MNKAVSTKIDQQTAWFERNMQNIARRLDERISSLIRELDSGRGHLLNTEENIQMWAQIYGSILEELSASGYTELVSRLNDKENDLLRTMKKSSVPGAVPLAFTQTSQSAITAFNSLWNARIGNLGNDVARQIHAIIGDSIFGGTNISELVKSVKAILDKQLVRYATTYVNTSRAKFIQMMQYEAARNYDGELFWIYEGPEDDVTRPVCREGTGMDVNAMFPNAPYFTEEERIEFESYSAPERTYNCRHTFMQITKEYYYDHVR